MSSAEEQQSQDLYPPRFPGEDRSETSDREIKGFYLYGWAAEVFVVCAMGSFIPMTLEQLARGKGVLASDRTTPCGTTIPSLSSFLVDTFTASSSFGSHIMGRKEAQQCICTILGYDINTAAFALYVFSISVFFQAILIVSISGAADHGRWRKPLLLTTACAGSIATMLFITATSERILWGAVLAIIANTCFGASFVLLNSFLPLLVRNHPDVRNHGLEVDTNPRIYEDGDDPDFQHPPLLSSSPQTTLVNDTKASGSVELKLSTRISSIGIGIGYGAAIIVQLACIAIVLSLRHKDPLWALRLSLFLIGFWWFVFTIPVVACLKSRPGPPIKLPAEKFTTGHHTTHFSRLLHRFRILWAYISVSWYSLIRTIGRARKLKDLIFFLFAWFLLSDGIATTSGTAILFAKTSLNMSSSAVALVSVLSTVSGFIGAFSWPRISAYYGLSPSKTMVVCNAMFALIPLYGLLGFIPAVERLGFGGLQTPAEIYGLALMYGFQLGGISAYCRAVFSELIPPGSEAAFFALHAITDKGSSVIGPAVVGAITNKYGAIRPAFWFLAVLVMVPIGFLAMVDLERGHEQACRMAAEVSGSDADTGDAADPVERRARYTDSN